MDLAPTFLEIAGISYPNSFEGRKVVPLRGKSLVPVLAGVSNVVHEENDPLGWELLGWRAIRMGKWKITWIDAPFGASEWQLFDLSRDPGETKDLSGENPAQLQRLLHEWNIYADEVGIIYAEKGLPGNF